MDRLRHWVRDIRHPARDSFSEWLRKRWPGHCKINWIHSQAGKRLLCEDHVLKQKQGNCVIDCRSPYLQVGDGLLIEVCVTANCRLIECGDTGQVLHRSAASIFIGGFWYWANPFRKTFPARFEITCSTSRISSVVHKVRMKPYDEGQTTVELSDWIVWGSSMVSMGMTDITSVACPCYTCEKANRNCRNCSYD